MEIVFLPFSEKVEVLIRNQAYEKDFWDACIIISNKRACFADLLAEVFEKRYLVAGAFSQEVPYVLPMCCMLQPPHSGQIWISKFQTAFRSSGMDKLIYFVLKRW